jgi:hypothetical protein
MASPYSVTILVAPLQFDPYATGHVAIAVNTLNGDPALPRRLWIRRIVIPLAEMRVA